MRPPSETGENKFWEPGRHVPLRHVPLRAAGRWTFDECAGRRPAIEAVAARPRRGAGANEVLKPHLSRCVAFAALPGAVRRPPRSARRRGAARSSCAAAGCWCPAPAPPPSRGRCAQQPRAAGALCPLRRRAAGRRRRHSRAPPARPLRLPVATQIAQQPHRAATRHFSVAGPTWLATILPRASRRARPLPSTRMADALEHLWSLENLLSSRSR